MALKFSTGLVNAIALDKSFKEAIEGTSAAGFYIDIYTGTRPSTPDTAATGTKLARFTAASAAKMHLDDSVTAGVIAKEPSEVWGATGLANGTAGYYRLVTSSDDGTTTSTTAVRIDGVIATSGGDLNMSSTTIAIDAPLLINTATFTIPGG